MNHNDNSFEIIYNFRFSFYLKMQAFNLINGRALLLESLQSDSEIPLGSFLPPSSSQTSNNAVSKVLWAEDHD